MTQYITYKYRIYPNKTQAEKIEDTFYACRVLHNAMLQDKIAQYEQTDAPGDFPIKDYRQDHPFLSTMDALALSHIKFELDKAFLSRDYRSGQYPAFRGSRTKESYVAPRVKIEGGKLMLPAVGAIRIVLHRAPPASDCLRATIIRTPAKHYFAALLYSVQLPKQAYIPISDEGTLGLDYSNPLFYVDSDGHHPDFPHFFEHEKARVEFLRRKLRRARRGSSQHEKTRLKLARLYEQIRNRRRDWMHKESHRLTEKYDTIVTETLSLRSIARLPHLGTRAYDNAFSTFQAMLAYKLARAGKHFYKLNPWLPTSQKCAHCGNINHALTLSDRFWKCPKCGRTISRDHNAALNIKSKIVFHSW